ncbi:MAG: hypothetical protein IJV45_08490 [Prevotella sp.]|nr:hypothetical protein [Prevotella sp.]
MFCYQPNFFSATQEVTAEFFSQLIVSDLVVGNIKRIRELRAAGDDASLKEADRLKRQLPAFIFQATFDETTSKRGFTGRWRKQAASRLNGLFILDIDHMQEKPTEWLRKRIATDGYDSRSRWADDRGIMLIHTTSSGAGLRLVAKADAQVGNIADNQHALAEKLGIKIDESCKDASRLSFCPGFEDIIYLDKHIFTYSNEEYDKKFGDQYRGGRSAATGNYTQAPAALVDGAPRSAVQSVGGAEQPSTPADGQGDAVAGELEPLTYHDVSYERIAHEWFVSQHGGEPQAGDRHRSLFALACDLRYITDNDPQLLARVLGQLSVGQQICRERGAAEIARIAGDACQKPLYRAVPKRVQRVLELAGVQLAAGAADEGARKTPALDYALWARRLDGLLSGSPVLREAVEALPEQHRMGGVLAAGAMLGTYLTRAWWEHFDGRDYRLSFLVYIIGDAASGKSFAVHMDKLLMAPMRAADNVGRAWERQYREDMKKRAASSKNARSEAPEEKHPVIRYVPSTISNAMLYRRLTDAIDDQSTDADGQTMHLHCYTFEPELATALRAQTGSWAGKLDLECKSFQNELAGVDYANDQSVNGIIQVNWNQVITGTPDALRRKIRPSTVLDGLVTRLCIFPMPSNDYAMIDRRKKVCDFQRDEMLRSVGLKLEQVKGELRGIGPLVDFCYEYEAGLTRQAAIEQDRCLDYFRKRIPLIMMRYAIVRLVLRQIDTAIAGQPLTVDDSDLEFARLIGDFVLTTQIHMFGQQVVEALEQQEQDFQPRRRSTKVREAFNRLPAEFTTEDVMQMLGLKSLSSAGTTCHRWIGDGLISKPKNRKYKKLVKSIDI